jgi:hypothetical protein
MNLKSLIFNTGDDGRIHPKLWVYPGLIALGLIGLALALSVKPQEARPEVISIRFQLENPSEITANWVDGKMENLQIMQEKKVHPRPQPSVTVPGCDAKAKRDKAERGQGR